MPQYPIPQFIEEEGKIIFFMTFKQFFWLVGGGAVCFVLYFTLPLWLFFILGTIVMLLDVILAFVKIEGASILKIILNYFNFSSGSKTYVWKKKKTKYPFKVKNYGSNEDLEELSNLKIYSSRQNPTSSYYDSRAKKQESKEDSESSSEPDLTSYSSRLKETKKMMEFKKK